MGKKRSNATKNNKSKKKVNSRYIIEAITDEGTYYGSIEQIFQANQFQGKQINPTSQTVKINKKHPVRIHVCNSEMLYSIAEIQPQTVSAILRNRSIESSGQIVKQEIKSRNHIIVGKTREGIKEIRVFTNPGPEAMGSFLVGVNGPDYPPRPKPVALFVTGKDFSPSPRGIKSNGSGSKSKGR